MEATVPFCVLQTWETGAQRGGLPKVTQLETGAVRIGIQIFQLQVWLWVRALPRTLLALVSCCPSFSFKGPRCLLASTLPHLCLPGQNAFLPGQLPLTLRPGSVTATSRKLPLTTPPKSSLGASPGACVASWGFPQQTVDHPLLKLGALLVRLLCQCKRLEGGGCSPNV